MANGDILMRLFPPTPLYPDAIDDDSTLYAVYNESESTLATDNQAWSEEVSIVPVAADEDDIWPGNGYINISGELIYYDLVETNSNGKTIKFKRCLRNFGGTFTQFNPQGTPVRGFVVAEHHNQLATAVLNIEEFVGYNFTPDQSTLDWRIRNLENTPSILDDYGCPTITLITETTSTSNVSGTTIAYTIDIIGSIDTFLLQFGDGSSTTSTQNGTHTYAPNATIDPVITATTGSCTITQTAIQRTSDASPQTNTANNIINLTIPNIPSIPDINISVDSDFQLPLIPINFPCLNLGISNFNIPSVIDINPGIPSVISGFDLPSIVTVIGGFTLPDSIAVTGAFSLPSTVTFIDSPDFPSLISFTNPNIPSVISFDEPFFPLLQVAVPTFPAINIIPPDIPPIQFGPTPTISVEWGPIPVLSCSPISIQCGGTSMAMYDNSYIQDYESEPLNATVDYNLAGIPSEIVIKPPKIDPIQVNHNIPNKIDVIVPNFKDININASSIPREIQLIVPEIRDLRVIHDIPSIIKLEHDLPGVIKLTGMKIPSIITINADSIPTEIKVTGMPAFIELKHNLPDFLQLRLPDEQIKIAPLDVNVNVKLDMAKIAADNEQDGTCFRLTPCN